MRIVEAASAVELEQFVEEIAACPKHPRRCGRAVTVVRTEGQVYWACGACDALGAVTGWEGLAVDRRFGPNAEVPMPASALTGPVGSWPKASDTFLAFAKPVIAHLRPVPEAWRHALSVPETVWNAVVLSDLLGKYTLLNQVVRELTGRPSEIFVEVLAARKRRLFAADWRLFDVMSVTLRDDIMFVEVGARDPRNMTP